MRTSYFARFTREEKATIEAALIYIGQHLGENMTVTGLSEQFNLKEKKLQRAVKLKTGTTLYSYIQQLRLNKAKLLLSTTDETIKSISTMVGMGNASNFGMVFKKATGLTPQAYRSQHGD